MDEFEERADVVRLLNQLGAGDEAAVLSSARELDAIITASGRSWDQLLVSDMPTPSIDAGVPLAPEGPYDTDGTLALIEEILSGPERSDALQEELAEYKVEIANGEFGARDHQYVRALYDRLTK